jgi:Flp pilus assembly protein TadB
MLIWAVAALSLAAGAPLPIVAAMGIVGLSPIRGTVLLAAVSAGYGLWHRRRTTRARSEAAFFREIAADVAAGSSLRAAIVRSDSEYVSDATRRLCVSGWSLADVGVEMAPALPVNGRRFSALCAMAEHSGSAVVEAVESFALSASADEELTRLRRSSLAQARMSAWVVGIAPIALTALVLVTQGIPQPGGAPVIIPMVIGIGLQLTGTAIVFAVSGRVVR